MRVLTLSLAALLGLAVGCGSEGRPYIPGDSQIPQDGLYLDSPDALTDLNLPDLPELPDASGIEADPKVATAVRILSPASGPFATVSNGDLTGNVAPTVSVSGVVFGPFEKVRVESEAGASADLESPEDAASSQVHYFTAPPLALQAPTEAIDALESRPTRVWVTVTTPNHDTIADSITIVANPGLQFPAPLAHEPGAIFAGETTEIQFTLDLNKIQNFDPSAVFIMESDATCSQKIDGTAKFMNDDGNLADSGDQIAKDKVYTRTLRIKSDTTGVKYYRAAVKTTIGDKTLVAYTGCATVFVVSRISEASCSSAQDILIKARNLYDVLLDAGKPVEEARNTIIAWLRTLPSVADAGADEGEVLVWAWFTGGFAGAVVPTVDTSGLLATALFPDAGSAPSGAIKPPSSRLVASTTTDAEGPLPAFLDDLRCPPWRMMAEGLRRLSEAGLGFLSGAGGNGLGGLDPALLDGLEQGYSAKGPEAASVLGNSYRGSRSIVFTDSKASCSDLQTTPNTCILQPDGTCCVRCDQDPPEYCPESLECLAFTLPGGPVPVGSLYDRTQVDLALLRLVLGPENWAVTSTFVEHYSAGQGPEVLYLGFSNSLSAPAAMASFVASGANTLMGTQQVVSADAAITSGVNLLKKLTEGSRTPAAVLPAIGQEYSDHPWRMVGSGNVDLSFAELLNSDFGTGSLKGWVHSGDARILTEWCGEGPVQQRMALLSTGIAFTVQTGEISQEFCLAADKLLFSGAWQFISHEFPESCGGTFYQDQFDLTLLDKEGQSLSLVDPDFQFVDVNMMCPCDSGTCAPCAQCGSPDCQCGIQHDAGDPNGFVLWPDECGFDYGDAYRTGWHVIDGVNISALAGLNKPLTLRIRVSDRGDSTSDSALLIDSLRFQ